jgi:hypothetical protein
MNTLSSHSSINHRFIVLTTSTLGGTIIILAIPLATLIKYLEWWRVVLSFQTLKNKPLFQVEVTVLNFSCIIFIIHTLLYVTNTFSAGKAIKKDVGSSKTSSEVKKPTGVKIKTEVDPPKPKVP